ncbi:hypothetical protein SYYSPA8_20070 [Streptomyces yaizuensis]|uniref:Uncharacterized protein n=1 Tax=Streptomyces yaizuensis TaxID=2989713 RepID=A0ABQ5P1Z4_9ACTN|nr:hypothetical protein [Streptomyces sp. YSPA8]GLF96633.1 hypothetical protein SYYSPA8_20070 [Streptomyces sp. YSPA8]
MPPTDAFARWALAHALATGHQDFRETEAEQMIPALAAAPAAV